MAIKTAKWRCGTCNLEHEELPLDIAFQKPQQFFGIPSAEVPERVFLNEDLCVIDEKIFLVRAFLPLPIRGEEKVFGWGIWAQLHQIDFQRYIQLYQEDGSREAPFRGFIASVVPTYPETMNLPVSVQLGRPTDRPILSVIPKTHPLYEEQTAGITLARAHEIIRTCLPHLFQTAG